MIDNRRRPLHRLYRAQDEATALLREAELGDVTVRVDEGRRELHVEIGAHDVDVVEDALRPLVGTVRITVVPKR